MSTDLHTVSEGIIDAQVNPLDNNRAHNNVCTVDMLRMRYHSLLVDLSVRFGSFRWEIHDACRDCLWVYQCVSLRAKLDTKAGKTNFTADHFSRTSSKITRLAFLPLSQRSRSRASYTCGKLGANSGGPEELSYRGVV